MEGRGFQCRQATDAEDNVAVEDVVEPGERSLVLRRIRSVGVDEEVDIGEQHQRPPSVSRSARTRAPPALGLPLRLAATRECVSNIKARGCFAVLRPETRCGKRPGVDPADARADDEDLADIEFLVQARHLDAGDLREAIDLAVVPPEYAELFAAARPKVLGLLARSA